MSEKLGIEGIKKLLELHKQGKQNKEIKKLLNCSEQWVYKNLKKNKLKANPVKKIKNKYLLRDDYFELIDNKEKAYFLGLLLADGYTNGHNEVILELKEEDKYILEKFSGELFEIHRPLILKKARRITWSNTYKVHFNGIKITEDLVKLGVIPNKTENLVLPDYNKIPKEFYSHLIRGFFDGDGSVSKNGYSFNIISNKKVIEHLKLLFEKLNIKDNNIYRSNCNFEAYVISNNKQADLFFDYIYKNSKDLRLERKYIRAQLIY